MTPLRTALVDQDYSARRLVAEQLPVLTHLAEGRVLVDVGTTVVTPAGAQPLANVHFCSAGFQLIQLLKSGDGKPVRQDTGYAVIVPKLWVPPEAGFLQFVATIKPNGCLKIETDPTVAPLFLPLSRRLMSEYPWSRADGRLAVAKSHGKRTLQEAFEAKGELLKI